jgi:hypothetical protein
MLKRFFESPEDQDPTFISLVRYILTFALAATVISAIAVAGSANSRALAITLAALVAAAV